MVFQKSMTDVCAGITACQVLLTKYFQVLLQSIGKKINWKLEKITYLMDLSKALHSTEERSRRRCSIKKVLLSILLCSLKIFFEDLQLHYTETPTQIFICEIFKNTFFKEYIQYSLLPNRRPMDLIKLS